MQAAAGALAGRVGDIVGLDRTLVGRVIRSGKPVLVGHYAAEFDTDGLDDLPDGIGAVIGGAGARDRTAPCAARWSSRTPRTRPTSP